MLVLWTDETKLELTRHNLPLSSADWLTSGNLQAVDSNYTSDRHDVFLYINYI